MFVEHEKRDPGINRERLPEAPVKLKLSDAMRIGAKKRPRHEGSPFGKGGSCAIGAAYEGRVGRPSQQEHTDPHMAQVLPEIYLSPGNYTPLGSEIWIRHDMRGMSREAVADWLESQGY